MSFIKEKQRIEEVATQLGITLPDTDNLVLLPVMEELVSRILLLEAAMPLKNWQPGDAERRSSADVRFPHNVSVFGAGRNRGDAP